MSENVFRQDDPNLPILTLIAKSLGTLCDSLVFVGGCATGLLLTTPRAQAIRATQDVDVVVHAVSTADYHAMEKAVESLSSSMIFRPRHRSAAGCCKAWRST